MNNHKMVVPRWALFPWLEEHGNDTIHPEDLRKVREIAPYGKVFLVEDENFDYFVLRYGGERVRIRSDLVKIVDRQARLVGETVKMCNGKEAKVTAVQWHHKKKKPFFLLDIEGKKKSKRYWENDFSS